jgi:Transposase DDE domain
MDAHGLARAGASDARRRDRAGRPAPYALGLLPFLGETPRAQAAARRLHRGHREALKKRNPLLGWDVAIDASDLPAYANGQRFKFKNGPERKTFSDPDASWGHRSAVSNRKGGGFYGYRLHMAVCSKTDLPLAWRVETGKANEIPTVGPLLDRLHTIGIDPETATMDKGYDASTVHDACMNRSVLPVIALRETPAVKRGEHKPPSCEHGEWRFAGAARSAARASGAVRLVHASLRLLGSRPTGCIRSSLARHCASRACTGVAPAWSARSAGSSTNGASRRCASAGSNVCSFMPTSRSSLNYRPHS